MGQLLASYPYLERGCAAGPTLRGEIGRGAGSTSGRRVKLLIDMNLSLGHHDLDFSSILAATGGQKPSVVQIRSGDTSPTVIGKAVVMALRQMMGELNEGALLTIDPKRARLRLLPLQARK